VVLTAGAKKEILDRFKLHEKDTGSKITRLRLVAGISMLKQVVLPNRQTGRLLSLPVKPLYW